MSDNHRYSFLDSTRGLAAFVVLLAHTIKTFTPEHFLSPFRLIWDSEAAVLYFFILSGFVLTESLQKKTFSIHSYFNYAMRRVFRIYPAFITILIIAFFALPLFDFQKTSWLIEYWQIPFTIKSLLSQALLIIRIPNDPDVRLLPHDWTLSIEIMISMFIPFLVLVSKKKSWLVLILAYLLVKILPIDQFIFDFSIGIFIAAEKEKLINIWNKMHFLGQAFLIVLALMLLQIEQILPHFFGPLQSALIHSKSWGLGILLITIVSTSKFQKLLTNKLLLFFGKISYSFYLFHLIILAIIFKSFPFLHFSTVLILVFTLTALFSFLTYQLIERPLIHISKKWFYGSRGK